MKCPQCGQANPDSARFSDREPRRSSDSMATGVRIRRIMPGEALALRELRLRAFADSPLAFVSRLADEASFPETVWRERASRGAAGERSPPSEVQKNLGRAASPGRSQLSAACRRGVNVLDVGSGPAPGGEHHGPRSVPPSARGLRARYHGCSWGHAGPRACRRHC
jgi:hypothetical protein